MEPGSSDQTEELSGTIACQVAVSDDCFCEVDSHTFQTQTHHRPRKRPHFPLQHFSLLPRAASTLGCVSTSRWLHLLSSASGIEVEIAQGSSLISVCRSSQLSAHSPSCEFVGRAQQRWANSTGARGLRFLMTVYVVDGTSTGLFDFMFDINTFTLQLLRFLILLNGSGQRTLCFSSVNSIIHIYRVPTVPEGTQSSSRFGQVLSVCVE